MFPVSSAFPVKGFQPVTWAIIALCVLVSLVQLILSPSLADGEFYLRYGAHPALAIFDFWPWNADSPAIALSAVTSMFVHAGILHLLFNMLFFHCFSEPVESLMGSVRYAPFYVLCGLAGVVVHCTIDPDSFTPLVGASGAVTGVLAAHTLLLPYTQIRIGLNSTTPAWGFTALWIFLQLLQSLGGDSTTAFGAHLGGGVAGLMLAPLFAKKGVQILARPVEDTEHALEYDEGFVVPRPVAAGAAVLLVAGLASMLTGRQESVAPSVAANGREWVALARLEGVGVPLDTQRGLAVYRIAAAQDPKIAARLASTLREGKIVPKDEAEAADWYRRAAELKDSAATAQYALMLIDGAGVPQDRERGLTLLRQLADDGYNSVDLQLAQVLEAGRGGGAPDLAGAVQRYRHACESSSSDDAKRKGHYESCRRYAQMLKEGRGTEPDPDKAAEILKQIEAQRLIDAGIEALRNRRL